MSIAGEPVYPGDMLQHRHFDDALKIWAQRVVKFVDFDDEPGIALVTWGGSETLYRVPVDELNRQTAKPPIFAPPSAASRSDSAISAPDLSPLRSALKFAHQ